MRIHWLSNSVSSILLIICHQFGFLNFMPSRATNSNDWRFVRWMRARAHRSVYYEKWFDMPCILEAIAVFVSCHWIFYTHQSIVWILIYFYFSPFFFSLLAIGKTLFLSKNKHRFLCAHRVLSIANGDLFGSIRMFVQRRRFFCVFNVKLVNHV